MRTIGVGDRFHQKAVHIASPGEELFEHLTRGLGVIIVEVHLAQMIVESLDLLAVDLEILDQNLGEVITVKRRPHIHLRVDETDILQLVDRIGDLLGPVFAAALNHPVGEAVQGNIEDVAAGAFEPGRQAAELVVVLKQQDLVPILRQIVCTRQSAQAGAHDHDVVFIFNPFKPVFCHL